jgi:hypothetical protein
MKFTTLISKKRKKRKKERFTHHREGVRKVINKSSRKELMSTTYSTGGRSQMGHLGSSRSNRAMQ